MSRGVEQSKAGVLGTPYTYRCCQIQNAEGQQDGTALGLGQICRRIYRKPLFAFFEKSSCGISDEVGHLTMEVSCKAPGCLDTLVGVFRRPSGWPLSDCL